MALAEGPAAAMARVAVEDAQRGGAGGEDESAAEAQKPTEEDFSYGDGLVAAEASNAYQVFNAFASHSTREGERMMTRNDFLRACVPVFRRERQEGDEQAGGDAPGACDEGKRLRIVRGPASWWSRPAALDRRIMRTRTTAAAHFFDRFDLNGDGLISFSEFVLFHALLAIPNRSAHIEVAFSMYDIDQDGYISAIEFVQAASAMCLRKVATWDTARVDWARTNLMRALFGEGMQKKITLKEFKSLLCSLHDSIIRLEFEHYDAGDRGFLTVRDFAESLVANAHSIDLPSYKKRIAKLPSRGVPLDSHEAAHRISYEQFHALAELRSTRSAQLMVALKAYSKAHGGLDEKAFQHALAAASPGARDLITPLMLRVIREIFDSNLDGNLDMGANLVDFAPVFGRGLSRERQRVYAMKTHQQRGSFEVMQLFECMAACVASGGQPDK